MKKHLFFLYTALTLLLIPAALKAQDTVTLGGVNQTYTSVSPFNSTSEYSFVEQIYAPSEIGYSQGGMITSIGFDLTNYESQTNHITIYMKNTSQHSFINGTNWVPVNSSDIVYDGYYTFTYGWNTIILDVPFQYDGTSNLMVAIHENTPGKSTIWFRSKEKALSVNYLGSDDSDVDPYNLGTGDAWERRASIQLIFAAAIPEVYINDFTAPAWGEHPDSDWDVPSDDYYVLFSDWSDATTGQILQSENVFDQEGHDYVKTYYLGCNHSHYFSDETTVYLNGDPFLIEEWGHDANGWYARTRPFRVHSGPTFTTTVYDEMETNNYVPLYGYYADAYLKSEFIMNRNELSDMTGGIISSMTFYTPTENMFWGDANFKVFLMEVAGTSYSNFLGETDATVVYEGGLSIVGNQMTVNFTTPYTYHGGNLLIGLYNTVKGTYHSCSWYGQYDAGFSVQGYSYDDLDSVHATYRDFFPKTTFEYYIPAVTIGESEAYTIWSPYSTLYNYSFVEQIYTAEEIGISEGGAVKIIGFKMQNTDEPQTTHITVYLKNVSRSIFSSTANYEPVSTADIVYEGTYTFNPGWNTITLDMPFDYNGTDNLMVAIHEETPDPSLRNFSYTTISNTVCYFASSTENPNPYNLDAYSGNSDISDYRADIKIGIIPYSTEIGTGTYTYYRLPVNMYYNYSLNQQIYTAGEIGHPEGGDITSVSFHYASDQPFSMEGVRMYLLNTNKSSFTSDIDLVSVTSSNLVYEGVFSATGSGWVTLHLSTPFHYTGGNLLLCMYDPINGYPGNTYQFYYSETENYSSLTYFNDNYIPALNNSNYNQVEYHYRLHYHNNIRLGFVVDPCPMSTNLFASNITETGADLGWDDTHSSYMVHYRPAHVALSESFEEGSGALPAGWTSEGDSEWSIAEGYGPDYIFDNPPVTPSGNYNAYLDHTSTGDETYLITPTMNLSGMSSATLGFSYINKKWGNDIDELTVFYRVNGGTWNEIYYTMDAHENWTSVEIPLTNLANNYQIGFKMTDAYGFGIGIDNVTVYEWESDDWTTVNTTASSCHLSGLDAGQQYLWQVSGNCGLNVSGWSGMEYFTTMGAEFHDTIDFETADFSQHPFSQDANYPWIVVDASNGCDNGSAYCMMSGNAGVNNSTSIIETTHTFETDGYITFDAKCMGEGTSALYDHCDFFIDGEEQFSHGRDVEGWQPYAFIVTAGSHTFSWSYTKDYSVSLEGDAFFVDNIIFGEGPLCMPITEINAIPTRDAAWVSWDGYSESYTLRYRFVGETWTTVTDITDNFYTISGLSVGDYEVEVAPSCDEGNWTASTFTIMELLSTSDWYGYARNLAFGQPWENQFIHFNMQDPDMVTQATSGLSSFYTTNAVYANGYVWCINDDRELTKASLDNDSHSISAFETVVENFDIYSIASSYNPVDGHIYFLAYDYAIGNYTLQSFDPADPENTLTTIGVTSLDASAIAINQNGEAYFLDEFGELYLLNLNDASYTLVGSTGIISTSYIQSLAFDMITDELFFSSTNDGGANLYKVDPVTAATMYIGQIGGGANIVGLFMVGETEETCLSPTDLTYSYVTKHTAELSWNENGTATEWQIILNNDEANIINVWGNPYILEDLDAETEYTVQVRSLCGDNWSDWSNEVTFTTEIGCSATEDLAVMDFSYHFATLTWMGEGESFNLRYRTSGGEWEEIEDVLSPYTLEGLESNTTYEVQVQNNCGIEGVSLWSNVVDFTTEVSVVPTYATITGESTVCQGHVTTLTANTDVEATYLWSNGLTDRYIYVGQGTYSVTVTSITGDELASEEFTVTEKSSYEAEDNRFICPSELPYTWNGVTFTDLGMEYVTLTASNGCDSIVTMYLSLYPTYDITEEREVCPAGLPYEWNGVTFTAAGTQIVTLPTVNGCDSVVTMILTVSDSYAITENRTVCPSELPLTWNGLTFTAAGTKTATLTAANGCDSVVTMVLTVNPTYTVTDARTICANELPYTWNSVTFTAAGTQNVTLHAVNGCDSVVAMTLTVNPNYAVPETRTICQSELPYRWNTVTFNAAGTKVDTLPTINGCDSIVTMTLIVNPTYNTHIEATICQGSSYDFFGTSLQYPDEYNYTLYSVNGCDSVITLTLHVNPIYNTEVFDTVCEGVSYNFFGDDLTGTGDYIYSAQAVTGCDSVVSLHLFVTPAVQTHISATACGSYYWNGDYRAVSGEYPMTLTSANGCDSVVTLHLTINQPTANDVYETACGSYTWNGTTYTTSSNYTVVLETVNGCDSVVTLHLTVNPTYDVTDAQTICASELPYLWNGVTFTAAGTQTVTLPTVNGCDSVVTMTLTVNPTYAVSDARTICESELPYTWNGVTFTAAGTQDVTLHAANGCDSVVTMTVTVKQTYAVNDSRTVCPSELPLTWNGITFTAAGTQAVTLTAANGCDSVVTMTVTVKQTYAVNDSRTVCPSELPLTWNGITFTAAGTQAATLTAANGCDSVVTMTVTVKQTYAVNDSRTVCPSELPLTWNGVTFTAAGTQAATLTAANGCDSVITMTVTVKQTYAVNDSRTVCPSELPLTWNGVTFTTAGTQSVTLPTVNGCDSVVTMTLTVTPTYAVTEAREVCPAGMPYSWNGVTFTAAGTQTVTLPTVNGCDSVVTMTLSVSDSYTVTENRIVCENAMPVTWNGYTFTAAGTHTVTLEAANGCDSVVTMVLTVNSIYAVTDAQTICANELPYIWNGVTFTAAGTQSVTLPTVNGCDSVVTMTLTVKPTYAVTDAQTICASELPYTWNGYTFTAAGTHTVTLEAANGCDSVVTMTLTVNPIYAVTDVRSVCPSELPYTWNGVSFSTAGTQNVTLPTANGCDSVVTMILTVNQTQVTTDSRTICESELPYTWNGVTFTAAGMNTATLQDVNGCDSTVIMTLIVNPAYAISQTMSICESELPYIWNGVTFTAAGTQNVTLQTVNGCDSVVTMTVTVKQTYAVNDSRTVCPAGLPYTWNGVTFTAAGTQTVTLQTVNGCDSVVTMTLSVSDAYTITENRTVCESTLPYAWNGYTFAEAGTHAVTLTAVNGCDSVVTMVLTVNPTYAMTDAQTICESELPYSWNGVTFTAAGTQNVTLQTVNGCDSVVTMTLTVNPTYAVTDAQTICEGALPYIWNGVTFTAAGTQSVTLTAANGCDSVVTMTLTVSNTYQVTDAATVCESALPYTWNGVTFTAAGTQSVTLTAANGCDSVVTMTLTISDALQTDVSETACDSYTWNGTTYTVSGNYSVTLTAANGCDSVVTLHLTINNAQQTDVSETACDSYTWNGTTYTVSGNYPVTLTAANGCDSVVTLHLTINQSTSSEFIIETSDSCYVWNGETYCASGDYVQTLQTVNGCDSVVTLHLTTSVGVENYQLSMVSLAPNPTKNICRIMGLETDPISVYIFDMRGKLVMRDDDTELDVSVLPTGMYMIRVNTGKRVINLKLIKQ